MSDFVAFSRYQRVKLLKKRCTEASSTGFSYNFSVKPKSWPNWLMGRNMILLFMYLFRFKPFFTAS